MEVLIVIAIIAILSSIIVVKQRNAEKNLRIRQCRANILEIALALDAYKASNDFYPTEIHGSAKGKIPALKRSWTEKYHLPFLYCPLGTREGCANSGALTQNYTNTSDLSDYQLNVTEDGQGFVIQCAIHQRLKDATSEVKRACQYARSYSPSGDSGDKSFEGFTGDDF